MGKPSKYPIEGVRFHVDVAFLMTSDHIHHLILGTMSLNMMQKEVIMLIFSTWFLESPSVILILAKQKHLSILFSLKNKRK